MAFSPNSMNFLQKNLIVIVQFWEWLPAGGQLLPCQGLRVATPRLPTELLLGFALLGRTKRPCRECRWRRWTGEPPHQPRRSNGILFFFFFFFIFIVFIFDVFISIIFIFLFFVLPQPSWSGSEWLQDLAKQSGSQALHSHLNQVLLKQQGIFILIYPVLIHVIKAMDIDRSPVQYATDSPLQANILMEMHAGTLKWSGQATLVKARGSRR